MRRRARPTGSGLRLEDDPAAECSWGPFGYERFDDAAVVQATTDIAVLQTVDFFPPIVNDPHVYGQRSDTH